MAAFTAAISLVLVVAIVSGVADDIIKKGK